MKHKFMSSDRVKYLGNKGVVVLFTHDTVTVTFVGPFIYGPKVLKVGTKEFKQLKKG